VPLQGLQQALVGFALGLRVPLASSALQLALTAHTDAKVAVLPPGVSAGQVRARATPPPPPPPPALG
jgi:hypothetical protein